MKYKNSQKAFSMIELVFVIVVLGIVSSIGAEIIAKVYENYIVQRAQHRASIKTQLALNQITNRIRYAVPNTIGRRIGKIGAFELNTDNLAGNGNDYTVLQWVGSDVESFEAIQDNTNRKPGWSGFLDINSSTNRILRTPASYLSLMNAIQINLGRAGSSFAVYFPRDTEAHYAVSSGDSSITLNSATNRIVERYKIAWTSYALVVEDNAKGKKDLMLYYKFKPTIGQAIGIDKYLLLKNVTTFKFQTLGQTTRIKICVEEQIGDGFSIPSCKEKAVF